MLKNRVKSILEDDPQMRDDDRELQIMVWLSEIMQQNYKIQDFFWMYGTGKLSHSESIRSCRQSLQREFPELRGVLYKKRQKYSYEVAKAKRENPGYVVDL